MGECVYTVTATMPDQKTGDRYVAWLKDGHIDAVLRGGATTGRILNVVEPEGAIRYQTQYIFPSMEAYHTYVREHAPALRSEGLERFGPNSGVVFERTVGLVV
ncbi:MAG: DUF4286 family protein [Phycisphaeraceae bacterium]|nr:DUF4286 family protein [Phycisphaerales bacterium]MCB9860945.1 DUF4286 family protein [Phycisphaeraceae bacterium]